MVAIGSGVLARENDQEVLSSTEKTKLESAMARGVNKAIIVGNLGQDPEVRYTAICTTVTNDTVAPTDSWNDRHTSDTNTLTVGQPVLFFIPMAEIATEYLQTRLQL